MPSALRSSSASPRTSFTPWVVHGAHETGRRPANGNTAPNAKSASDMPATDDTGHGERVPGAQTPENVVMHPAAARPFQAAPRNAPVNGNGPVPDAPETMRASEPELSPAPIEPAAREDKPATSWSSEQPTGATAEPTVTIAATRERITYTLPVSEARLPASLLARRRPDAIEACPLAVATSTAFEASPALPQPPASPPTAAVDVTATVVPGPVTADDDLLSMALRLGPGARERQ